MILPATKRLQTRKFELAQLLKFNFGIWNRLIDNFVHLAKQDEREFEQKWLCTRAL